MNTEKRTTPDISETTRPDTNRSYIEPATPQAGNIILSVIMAVLGLTFIWLCDRHVIGSTVLIAGGLSFIIPGAALLLSLLVRRGQKPRATVMTFLTAICGLAAVVLGIVILVAPESFRHLLVYLFGGLLVVASAWQFDMMMRKNRSISYPTWLSIAPALGVALGVVMCTLETFKGDSNEKWMMLATGCGFTVFGIIGLFISYYAIKARHAAKKLAASSPDTDNEIAAGPDTTPIPTVETTD